MKQDARRRQRRHEPPGQGPAPRQGPPPDTGPEVLPAYEAMLNSSYAAPPFSPDDLLQLRGIDLYERMMTDAMVRAAINTKRFALLAKPWQVVAATTAPAGKASAADKEVCEFVEDALNGMTGSDGCTRDFRQTLFQMMSAFYRGFSLGELVWRLEADGRWAGKYRLAAIKYKSPQQIGFQMDDFLNIKQIVSWTPVGGRTLVPREKCVLYIYNPKDEMPYGESDLRAVHKHFMSKDALMKYWNLYMQKHAFPMVYAQVGPALNSETAQRVLRLLEDMQQDSTAIFPRDITPQILEKSAGAADAFSNAVDWHNQQIAQGILLQTLTSGEGRRVGSLSLGRVHFDILLYVLEAARADIEAVVNSQIIRPLVRCNFDDAEARMPRFCMGSVNEKDILPLAQAYDVLLTHGVVGSHEQSVRELFDLPPLEEERSEV